MKEKPAAEKIDPVKDFNNPAVVTSEAENILGPDMKFAYKGNFDKDSVIEIAAGTEIETKNEWGITILFIKT